MNEASLNHAYIYEAIRTPRGKASVDGSLYSIKPISLLVGLMRALQQHHQLDTGLIDDILLGCATPVADLGANLGRIAALAAGWDCKVAGMQLNRFDASGLEAINLAAHKVRSGWDELIVAGGVAHLSRVPLGADGGAWSDDPETSLRTAYLPSGVSADLIATLNGYPRHQLDAYALCSQQKATAARAAGHFRCMVPVRDQNGVPVLDHDELVRPATSAELLAQLPPAFEALGLSGFDSIALRQYTQLAQLRHPHTAANIAAGADGAALALIGSKTAGARLGLEPRARIVAVATTGSEPVIMLTGAVAAARKALGKCGLSINDIDLCEIHEACAAVALHFMATLEVAEDKLNVNGGAIAFGDPYGASGGMLLATLLDELEARRLRRGLIAMPSSAGMAVATIIERC